MPRKNKTDDLCAKAAKYLAAVSTYHAKNYTSYDIEIEYLAARVMHLELMTVVEKLAQRHDECFDDDGTFHMD